MPSLAKPTILVGQIFAIFLLLCNMTWTMRVNPERIAARLRIEQEIEMDKLLSRNRRQLGVTPKEISISVTAPLFSSRLFTYGPETNDQELPRSLDVGRKLPLTYPIRFYGQEHYTVYILSNGGIGFEPTSRSYKSNILPSAAEIIAPFWNRNDLRSGGRVYYREEKAGRVLERGQSEIRYQYDLAVKVKSCLLVTWEKMQPHGAAALPDDNTNTFQAALFVTDNGTFANFIYKNIGWTQGAEAGFNKGDSAKHFALPTSGTGNIMYLEEYGNTGIPGEWMFVFADQRVERCKNGVKGDTCDEECASGEWGPDCANCCHCASGSCNSVTGDCAKGLCAECWTGPPSCQSKQDQCSAMKNVQCAHNAVSFMDFDRCGEPVQRCQCLAGYKGVGNVECIDVDECAKPGTCHQNAVCTNTPGGFFCQCNENYSGDGVTECISSFFYPFEGHQSLPKSKNAKVSWQLKYPITVFGKPRDHLTISTNGIIAIEDATNMKANERLDDVGVHGIAPFFAPIDVTKRGEVFIAETTDSDVLTRATRTVRENFYDDTFVATSVLTVTFINVTDGKQNANGSSFQALLIGGINEQRQNLTFTQLLYKKLPWGAGAEAGIMSYDDANSILLPGSGTEGIEQLSQLSNIRVPGQWLYRIDSPEIRPCARSNLQPPYCNSEIEISNEKRPQPSPTPVPLPAASSKPTYSRPATTQESVQKKPSRPKTMPEEVFEIPGPRIIQPVLVGSLPSRHMPGPPVTSPYVISPRTSPKPSMSITTKARPDYNIKPYTPHVPIVSIDSHDIEDIPPDAFDVTFPPFITVVPQVFAPKGDARFSESVPSAVGTIKEVDMEGVNLQPENSAKKPSAEGSEPSNRLNPEDSKKSSVVIKTKLPDVDFDKDASVEHEQANSSEVPPVVPPEPNVVTQLRPSLTGDSEEAEVPKKPLHVFSTSPPKRPPPTKPRLVTAGAPTAEATSSNLAVIIPTAIIAVWLLLLAIIALFCCCRRKRAEREFRDLYLPNHQVRPLSTTYGVRKNSKNYDVSYEDHLEKAARLSSEMNSYAQAGRYSLYGSYWNLNDTPTASASCASAMARHSPYSHYAPQQRHVYNGRY